jgi:hypothetical protein
MLANLAAGALFLAALLVGHSDYTAGSLGGGPFALTLIGLTCLTLGGWLGGTIVFVYGMRVLGIADVPALEAVKPEPNEEKRAA